MLDNSLKTTKYYEVRGLNHLYVLFVAYSYLLYLCNASCKKGSTHAQMQLKLAIKIIFKICCLYHKIIYHIENIPEI